MGLRKIISLISLIGLIFLFQSEANAATYGIHGATSLIGGGVGALDKIDGAILNAGDSAVVVTSTYRYFYTVKTSGCGAEFSPDTIIPDTNPGTKCWIRITASNLEDFKLESLKNVASMAESEGQILYYDATTGLWKNTSILRIDDVNNRVVIGTTTPLE